MSFKIEKKKTDQLLFDYQNPRLSEFGVTANTPQEEILQKLWELMGAEEIYLSISASGFFEHEPIIVIKQPTSQTEQFIVIEGNRRLAAVKAILHPELIEEINTSHLPKIEDKKQLEELPCLIVNSRTDAWRFIGFKHVNGPAKWGSYAKAKFIAQIRKEHGLSISEIARQIGDTSKIAQKLFQALMVIEQAEKEKVFNRDDINAPRLYFSHLYNGLNHENIKTYIGLEEGNGETADPVPPNKVKELGELLTWIFGSKKNDAKPLVTSQNPDLKRLSTALGSKESVAALRASQSLDVAYEISLPDPLKFEQSLNDAKRALYDVQKYLPTGYDGKDRELLQTSKTIAELADAIFFGMKERYDRLNPKQQKIRAID